MASKKRPLALLSAVWRFSSCLMFGLLAACGGDQSAPTTSPTSLKPASLSLSAANYSVAQSSGSVTITVNRTGGSDMAVSVAYATNDGTAVAGSNYTATSGTLSWAAGNTSAATIAVPLSTTAFSGTKTFTVTLSQPGGGASLGTPATATVSISGSALSSALSIKVSGNHFVDGSGNTVQLRGVNVSGLEFVAIDGFDPGNPWGGQTGDPTPNWTVIKSWGVNAVRLPLNEASWLAVQCVDIGGNGQTASGPNAPGQIVAADPGNNYVATVKQSIAAANAAGLYVILDLHWAAPKDGSTAACPTVQNAMADSDYSVSFWSSVASTFQNNPAVIFELFNEPFVGESSLAGSDTQPAWYYILNGGGTETTLLATGSPASINLTWSTAGMQTMLNAVRATGATNVVLTSTDNWSSSLDQWLAHRPTDSASQLGAVWHAYSASDYGYPTQVSCVGLPQCSAGIMSAAKAILAADFPVVITEFGDTITNNPGNSSPWASVLLPFADTNGISYLGWTWDTWTGYSADVLITDAAGDPTNGYGTYVKQHYQCVAAGTANCP